MISDNDEAYAFNRWVTDGKPTVKRSPMTAPLCPTCGRRPSERKGWASRPGYKSKHVRVLAECLHPCHDIADYGLVLLEALREFKRERGKHDGPHYVPTADAPDGLVKGCVQCELSYIEAEARLDAAIAAVEGRKEEKDE